MNGLNDSLILAANIWFAWNAGVKVATLSVFASKEDRGLIAGSVKAQD